MNIKSIFLRSAIIVSAAVTISSDAAPRSPLPPMPEFERVTFAEQFDGYYRKDALAAEISVSGYGQLVESWSGYALQRAGAVVPFIIDGVDRQGQTNVMGDAGAVRLWVKPYWSSASTGEGKGPEQVAQVLELSVAGQQQAAPVWSLRVSADGSLISLVGAGEKESGLLLKAEIAWRAGEWHQVVLNYSAKGTALVLDGEFVAEGAGVLAVPPRAVVLAVGSSMMGTESFGGEIEEVFCFARPLKREFHYQAFKELAALGPIRAEEIAYRAELAAKWKAQKAQQTKAAEESGNHGGLMLRMAGPVVDCVTNGPVYLTNVVCSFTTNEGWTVAFDIAGGTNEVGYDIFATPELVGNDLTNSMWTWLETGLTCETHAFTNQATNQMFYILTVPGADRDGDGLYDGWEWKHFGTLAQTAAGDFDEDGVSNLLEYQYGTDPNTVVAVVRFESHSFNTTTITGLVEVLQGVAAREAILVNSANRFGATWLDYQQAATFTLGPTDGVYTVSLGMKGRASGPQMTWYETEVTLDRVPPQIVIVNPTTLLAKSLVQLQGYCPEELQTVTCSISNVVGVQTNIPGSFTGAGARPVTVFEFSNLPLAEGTNVFSLKAVDLAGNVAVTNWTCVRNILGDTNPPELKIKWPANDAWIAESNVTLIGHVEDETTVIAAELISPAGVTNVYRGLNERDGAFWLESLPLDIGTNQLKVMATDEAGNSSTTNLTLIRNSVLITMDPLAGEELNELYVTVTGNINTSGYQVWINGVAATMQTNGNWTAVEVPVTSGGTAVFKLTAILLTDNGGSGDGGGSGGGGGGGGGTNPGATTPSNPPEAAPAPQKPHAKKLAEGKWTRHDENLAFDSGLYFSWDYSYTVNETNGSFGSYQHVEVIFSAEVASGYRFWLDKKGHQRAEHWADNPNNIVSTNTIYLPDFLNALYVSGGPYARGVLGWAEFGPYGVISYKDTAESKVMLSTGGRAGVSRTNVFAATATATEVVPEQTRVIPKTNITITSFAKIYALGYVCAELPDNAEKEITPTVVAGYYRYAVGADKYAFNSTCTATTPTNRSRTDLGVGEYVRVAFDRIGDLTVPSITAAWTATGGSVPNLTGISTTFTARSNAGSASVSAAIPGIVKKMEFNVVEPEGVASAKIISTSKNPPIGTNIAGAWMRLNVTIAPTNVSFYRVQVWEEGKNATNVTDYFTNHWPVAHGTLQGANKWHDVLYNNLIGDQINDLMDTCSYWGNLLPSPWSPGGSFTWPIPGKWRISGGATNSLPWSDQVFTLGGDGTMTITKFGKSVTRTINEVRTPNLP